MNHAKTLEDLLQIGRKIAEKERSEELNTVLIDEVRRLLRVRDRNGQEIPLKANTAQLEFERARRQNNIVLKARQMGMTTWIAARFFLKTITQEGVLTVQVAQTREAAEGIFRMVQRFWERLPEDLREGPLKRSRANLRQMIFPELDSEFRVLSAADESAGRGLTIQNLHCSEVSRWPGDAAETLAGLRAALSPTGEMTLESTPNGAYGCFYEEWMRAEDSGTMARHFFPWWLEKAYVSAPATNWSDEEEELVLRHNLTAEQIGFRRTLEASFHGLRAQEFAEDPTRCFRASGECCFETDAIERKLEELRDPRKTRRNGALHIWAEPFADKQYLVAVDPAGGGANGDFAAIQVIEQQSGLQCAELAQRLSPYETAKAAAELAREYNNALLIVERNNHGAGVLAFLAATERYRNIYESNAVGGWLTTASSKPEIVSRLGVLLVENPGFFSSKRLLHECRTFVLQENGSTGAAAGAHDDCVMAMAIAHAVRAELLQKPKRRE